MRTKRNRSAQISYRHIGRARLFLEPLEDRRLLATFVDAVNDSAVTNEDTPVVIQVKANDVSDPPGSPLGLVSVSQPTNGTATINANQTVTYTPKANFAGTDTFTYTIWDNSSPIIPVTVGRSTLDLHARANSNNQASTAKYDWRTNMQAGTTSMLRGTVSAISTNNGRVEMSAYGEATWTNPSQGEILFNSVIWDRINSVQGSASLVEGSGWTYEFTPSRNGMFILNHNIQMTNTFGTQELGEFRLGWKGGGVDSYQLINADNQANSFGQTGFLVQAGVTYTVSLHVNFALAWGGQFPVNDREAMGALFNFRIVDRPLADTATVTVSVGPMSDAPVAHGWQLGTDEEVPLNEFLRANDADGDALTYSVVQNPGFGTVTVHPTTGAFTYTPQANYFGTDSFTFKVNDGTADSNIARIYVTVRDVNDPLVVNDDTAVTNEDTGVNISWWQNDTDPDNESPVLVSHTQPTNGTVTIGVSAPFFRYTPNANFVGTDTFTYTARDRGGVQRTGTVTVTVNAVNDLPVANNLSIWTNEDMPISRQVTGSDEETAVTFAVATGPSNGSLVFNTDGTFTYTPNPNYFGNDSFTFTAHDGQQLSAPATVTIGIESLNDLPVAIDAQFTSSEDVLLQGSLSATDADGNALRYEVVDLPGSGFVDVNPSTGAFIYTPFAEFAGTDRFTFRVHDDRGYSNVAEVLITVTATNDPPLAPGAAFATDEESPLSGQLPASDAEKSPLAYTVVNGPTSGTLTVNPSTGNFVYTPKTNFVGSDVFTYKVNDGNSDSNIARVTITVNNVNDAPVANDDSATTNEDSAAAIFVIANDTDIEKSSLTIVSFAQGANGRVERGVGAPFLWYTPDLNFNGTDTFTYTIRDSSGATATATVSVTVTAVNDRPYAGSMLIATDEDQAVSGQAAGSDVESVVTFVLEAGPAHGDLSFNTDGTFTYTPGPNYVGTDRFTFRTNDGVLSSDLATVTISVGTVNDVPVAADAMLTGAEDASVQGSLEASDVDGDALTYALVDKPLSGTLALDTSTGSFVYTPAENYTGDASFTYRVFDGTAYSSIATVSISIIPVNDRPLAQHVQLSTNEEQTVSSQAVGTDVDSSITFAIESGPAHGGLIFNADGTFTYTPERNYFGSDSFTFRTSDGVLSSDPATVAIRVAEVNDDPLAEDVAVSGAEDSQLQGTLDASDVDGDALSYEIIDEPQFGTVTLDESTGSFLYTPNPNFFGDDSFTYQASDGLASSAVATVAIRLTPVNDRPVASTQNVTIAEDGTAAIILSAMDIENGNSSLTFAVQSQPQYGSLSFDSGTGSYIYRPAANFHGTDSFTFTASDGDAVSEPATVSITVSSVNDVPVVQGQSATTSEDKPLTGALKAEDADGSALKYRIVTAPQHGALSNFDSNTGAYTYTPSANYNGSDSFTFVANDGSVDSASAMVTLTITPVNDPPRVTAALFSLAENAALGTLVGTILASDIDDAIQSFVLGGDDAAAFTIDRQTGAISVANPALLDYETKPTLQFTVAVTDTAGDRSTAAVTVQLTDVLEMAMDVAPGDSTNRIDLGSATIEVAILAVAGFDPLAQIDLGSLRLRGPGSSTGAAVQSHPKQGYKYELRDVNGDQRADLVLRFDTAATGLKVGDTRVTLAGRLKSGQAFSLEQAVQVFAPTKGTKGGSKGK